VDTPTATDESRPRRRRRGILIASLVLVAIVVLCGGGGTIAFYALRSSGGQGQATPLAATSNFLNAVYKEKNATKAGRYVCAAARSEKSIDRKVDEVADYERRYAKAPRFTWDEPTVESTGKKAATLSVTIRFATDDDRAAFQRLEITAVDDNGWYVCDVRSVS
jgi:hypothetical protein